MLSSNALVLRLTHEDTTNFSLLSNFDNKRIKNLPKVYKNGIPFVEADATNSIATEASVTRASIYSTSVSNLISAVSASTHYGSIDNVVNPHKMDYASFLATFKIRHESCLSVKDNDDSKAPKINDRDKDRKIISWSPIFMDFLSNSYRLRSPLIFFLREHPTITNKIMEPLLANC